MGGLAEATGGKKPSLVLHGLVFGGLLDVLSEALRHLFLD